MLTRKKAISNYGTNKLSALDEVAFEVIGDIYDSIGSCADCKFIGDRKIFCGEHGFFVPSNGYCWKFERKDDE